jgi:hypothetical protein
MIGTVIGDNVGFHKTCKVGLLKINCLCMNGENHELFNSHEDAKILKTASLMKADSCLCQAPSEGLQPTQSGLLDFCIQRQL